MVFPVRCEKWAIKKAESQRIDALEEASNGAGEDLRVLWTTTKSTLNVHWKVEAPILWLPVEKTLMLGKTESKKRRGQQKMRRLDGITDSMDMSLSKLL